MFPVKQLLLLVLCTCLFIVSLAQSGKDTIPVREQHRDTSHIKKDTTVKIIADTAVAALKDSTVADSLRPVKPPVVVSRPDSVIPVATVMKGTGLPEPRPTLEGFHNTMRNHPY